MCLILHTFPLFVHICYFSTKWLPCLHVPETAASLQSFQVRLQGQDPKLCCGKKNILGWFQWIFHCRLFDRDTLFLCFFSLCSLIIDCKLEMNCVCSKSSPAVSTHTVSHTVCTSLHTLLTDIQYTCKYILTPHEPRHSSFAGQLIRWDIMGC